MQEHDRRKISYALANKIKIYIIPFWEIDKITSADQLFQEKYLARSRWKNDGELVNSPLYQKRWMIEADNYLYMEANKD